MVEIVTNRDLSLAVNQLVAQYDGTARPLEKYLWALWGIGLRHCDRTGFTPDEFFGMLAEAFVAEPASCTADFLDDGSDIRELELLDTLGYEGWEYRVARQVVDLQEMAESGQLEDPYRYFGIDSPRGSRWYNFSTCAFLDRAMAGEFGDRDWSEEPESEVEPLGTISWERFRAFLGEGQTYE